MASHSPRASFSAVVAPPSASSPPPPQRSKFWTLFLGVPGLIAGAVLGVIVGYSLQRSSPSAVLVSWIGIPGNLFIRAIQCLVAPLVFCSLLVGMADMVAVGKAGAIGWRTAVCYLFTSAVSSCEGLIIVIIARSHFGNKADKQTTSDSTPAFALACDQPGYFLSHANDTVACVFDATYNATSTFSPTSVFNVTDVHKSFASASTGFVKRSLSDALQGQLQTMVPSNLTQAFANATLLSIIMFAIPFGIAISLLPRDKQVVANFFREINSVFMQMIQWVIVCTPVAIVSLLASAIAQQSDLKSLVTDVGLYVLCALSALLFHTLVFYPLWLRAFVKGNPYKWMRQMSRAQIFAFGSSSSMATLPVVMDCVEQTGVVSRTLSRFVLALGATIGMDGAALVYPINIVFMAETQGLGHLIGGVEYFLIALVSTIGSVGAGPVPSAGSVMTITIWASVFPNLALPATFAYVIATDWFIDRFQTVVNVVCDTVVTRIVAEVVGETTTLDDHEKERESLVSATQNAELKQRLSVADGGIDSRV
jgi:Na+/H+-dicarboxylate symporter